MWKTQETRSWEQRREFFREFTSLLVLLLFHFPHFSLKNGANYIYQGDFVIHTDGEVGSNNSD